jgi:serine/threonine protein kinase
MSAKIPDTASVRPPTPAGGTNKRIDLDSRFDWGKLLGRGSYADVVLVTERGEKKVPYAMKVIDKRQIKSKHQMQELLREIRIMRVVKQHHIVRLYEVFETERKVYLQME